MRPPQERLGWADIAFTVALMLAVIYLVAWR